MKSLQKSCSTSPSSDPLSLARGRVHEAEGRSRRGFAAFQANRHVGPVFWILSAHEPQHPLVWGLPSGLSERLLLLRPTSEIELLWSVEEALRVATVGLVIAEPQKPLSLTAGRRLQLAAEAGGTTGLMLIREGQGSNATETRWRCDAEPATAPDSTPQRWSLTMNKRGTLGSWIVSWNGTSAAFDMVSAARQRHEPADAPD